MRPVRYFLSPISGRIIKSSGKTYATLKQEGYIIDKHKCFYNIKSAQKCLAKLGTLYPSVLPPSKFYKIPKMIKNSTIRGFVQDEGKVLGVVDSKGKIYRLQRPLNASPDLVTVDDPVGTLPQITLQSPYASLQTEKEAKQIAKSATKFEKRLLYNPVQNDFIPTKVQLEKQKQIDVINAINQNLIPLELPPISKGSDIAGIVTQDFEVVGVVTTDNEIQKLDRSIPINESEATEEPTQESEATEATTDSTDSIEEASEAKTEAIDSTDSIEEATEATTEATDSTEEASEAKTEATEEATEEATDVVDESDPVTLTNTPVESRKGSIDGSLLATLPVMEADDDVKKALDESQAKNSIGVMRELECLNGDQIDVSVQKCLPCTAYNMVWDPEFKKCRVVLSPEITAMVYQPDGETIIGYVNTN
jgi:hypothetical protein